MSNAPRKRPAVKAPPKPRLRPVAITVQMQFVEDAGDGGALTPLPPFTVQVPPNDLADWAAGALAPAALADLYRQYLAEKARQSGA